MYSLKERVKILAKRKTIYVCSECGHESLKWMGKCTNCNQWNTFTEEVKQPSNSQHAPMSTLTEGGSKPMKINKIQSEKEPRITIQMKEFNRVLGGGIVPGSLVLIGGDPGIGKSTLLLQTSSQIAEKKLRTIYVSEELFVLAETNLYHILQHMKEIKPDFVVIDSIQTVFKEEVTSAPGSVSQVRECTMELMKAAKQNGLPIFIVGHVTKEGAIAG